MKQEASQPRPARPRSPACSAQLAHAAHEAGPATLYLPRAHKPLTSRTRPSAITHRAPPHQDKLTNGPPLSAAQLQCHRLSHAPSTTRLGADQRGRCGPGGHARCMTLFPPRAAPTLLPRAIGCAARITTTRSPSTIGALELGYKSQRP